MKDGFYIYCFRHNSTLAWRNIHPYSKQEALEVYKSVTSKKEYKYVELRSVFSNRMKTISEYAEGHFNPTHLPAF